nr:hypothetical protein [Flavobacterium inviolabile]
MMKINRHISLLLAMLILVSNVGLAFNVHYCGGEIASVSLAYKSEVPCVKIAEEENSCCAATGKKDDCCSNSKVDLKKNTTDNIIVKSFQLDLGAFTFADSWKPEITEAVETAVVNSDAPSFYCDSNAPPLFKLYCQYIFYA